MPTRRHLLALAGAPMLAAIPDASRAQMPAPEWSRRVHFYGRWDRRDASRAETVNSGSHVVGRFEGTSLTARFDTAVNRPPMPTLCWRIDDGEWQEAELAATVPLAADLPRRAHGFTLMVRDLDEHQSRWSRPRVASVTLTGLEVAGGTWLPAPEPPRLKLEFLGDSITEGVLVHPPRPGKETWPWRGDGRLAYSAQTAMRLGAQWRQVGFGRLGVTIEGNGGVPVAPDSFNFFHADCPRDTWQPDAVIINQGTNDGGRRPEVFRPAYQRYLRTVRAAYPRARIFALRPFNGAHAESILSLVTAQKLVGDHDTYFIETTGWLGPGDFTDGVHPNAQGGARAADRLAAELRVYLKDLL